VADWTADVKNYRADADDAAIAGLLKTYRLVTDSQDSAYVAFSDEDEVETVKANLLNKANLLKKKLGLTDSDEALDAALDEVKETMKADRIAILA